MMTQIVILIKLFKRPLPEASSDGDPGKAYVVSKTVFIDIKHSRVSSQHTI
jgi:hypothetical protein